MLLHAPGTRSTAFLTRPSHTAPTVLCFLSRWSRLLAVAAALTANRPFSCPPVSTFRRRNSHSVHSSARSCTRVILRFAGGRGRVAQSQLWERSTTAADAAAGPELGLMPLLRTGSVVLCSSVALCTRIDGTNSCRHAHAILIITSWKIAPAVKAREERYCARGFTLAGWPEEPYFAFTSR